MRSYLLQTKDVLANKYYLSTLRNLSPALQGVLCHHSIGESIALVPFFQAADQDERDHFVPMIATQMETKAYAENEVIHKANDLVSGLHICLKGIIGYGNSVIGRRGVLDSR